VADKATPAFGVIVTLMLQLDPAERLRPQSFVCAKFVLFVPPIAIVEIGREAVPEFVSVTVCTALVVPTFCGAKLSAVTDNAAFATGGTIPN
jgi:hypothetical protein